MEHKRKHLTLRVLNIPAAIFKLRWTSLASSSVMLRHKLNKPVRSITHTHCEVCDNSQYFLQDLLLLSCPSRGKLSVPDGHIKGHRHQFKHCVLLGTDRENLFNTRTITLLRTHAEWNTLITCDCGIFSLNYLAIFPCKVSVHLKLWMKRSLFSCVVPSSGKINPAHISKQQRFYITKQNKPMPPPGRKNCSLSKFEHFWDAKAIQTL